MKMNQLQKDIAVLHRRDCLAEAEQETGISYKKSDLVALLGMAKMKSINEQKKAAAILTMDTYFSMPLADYISCVVALGFAQILHQNFKAKHCGELMKCEEFIFWHNSKAILLHFDTYYGESVNGGKFYYNVRPKNKHGLSSTSSGSYNEAGIWSGDHDCREAVKHHIEMLEDDGEFLTPWVQRPSLWLLNWSESKPEGYDYKKINESKIAQFPEHVRKAITP